MRFFRVEEVETIMDFTEFRHEAAPGITTSAFVYVNGYYFGIRSSEATM